MSKITISINAENASELSATILELAATMQVVEKNEDKPKRQSRKPEEIVLIGEIKIDHPTQTLVVESSTLVANLNSPTLEPVVEPVVEDEPTFTAAQLREKAAEVAKSGKHPQVKALLVEFGAANISTIPEDQRLAFFKALEAL